MEISKAYNCNPFDVLERDTENVILSINYFMEKLDKEPQSVEMPTVKQSGEVKRRKVTSATATGGWF